MRGEHIGEYYRGCLGGYWVACHAKLGHSRHCEGALKFSDILQGPSSTSIMMRSV